MISRRRPQLLALTLALLHAASVVFPPIAHAHDFAVPGGTEPKATPGSEAGATDGTKQSAAKNRSDKDPSVPPKIDPVDLHRGEYLLTRQDINLPGRGVSVAMAFTYRSRSAYNGGFGYGWDMTYNRRVRKLDNNNLVVLRGDTRKDEFTFTAPNSYIAPAGVYDALVQNADGTYTLTSKHGDVEQYDTSGRLTKLVDRNGNALTLSYDPAGLLPISGPSAYFVAQATGVVGREYRLTRITDATNRVVDFAYDATGRVSTIACLGRTVSYAYDAEGNLISVTAPATTDFPAGTTTRYAYASHNLTTITDAKSQLYLSNTYDPVTDRVTSQTYGAATTTLVYGKDATNAATTNVTDRNGNKSRYTFDAVGHITKLELFADGIPAGELTTSTTLYEYNAAGERTRAVLPHGNAVEYTYDPLGNLLTIRRKKAGLPKGVADPSDLVASFTYESRYNFVRQATDFNGNATAYTYDYDLGEPTHGNLRKITFPSVGGQTIQTVIVYNSVGQVTSVTDPQGTIAAYAYDLTTGLPNSITEASGSTVAGTTTLTYDTASNVTSIKDPRGNITGFIYTAQNQLSRVTAATPFSFQTNYRYDANGNLIRVDRQTTASPSALPVVTAAPAPADGWQTTLYGYTILDQLASVTDDLSRVTSFAYDGTGNRTTVTDAKSQTTTYAYDELNRLLSVTDPRTPAGVTAYRYDANSNLAQLLDPSGHATVYAYDDFDRLVSVTDAAGRAETYAYDANANLTRRVTPASETISYAYDARNRLASVVTPSETRTYTYDRVGRVLTAANALGMLTHVYDARGRLAQVTAPGAKTVGYGYDAANNRTTLTYPTGTAVTYTYDALGRLATLADLNAQPIALAYDPLSQRTSLTLPTGVVTTSAYDAASQLTTLTTAKSGVTLVGLSYAYDALGNRASETRQPATVSAAYTYDATSQLTTVSTPAVSYAYDAAGNRTTVAGVAYTTNVLNQYTQVGAASLTYDLKGNLLSDGTQTYTYDAENRLTRVVRGATTVLYTYDALGRRASRSVNGLVTQFLYDGAALVAETDAAGTVTAQQLFGPRIDEPLERKVGTTTSYYASDALGSIVALTNPTGALVETITYDAFGTPTLKNASGSLIPTSTVGNRFLFTGREWEAEVQLYDYRARAYSPTLGRFLQRDPLGLAPDPNPYRYTGNDPLDWTDPSGTDKHWFNGGGEFLGNTFLHADSLRDAVALLQVGNGPERLLALVGIVALGADAVFNVASLGGKTAVSAGTERVIQRTITLKPGQLLFRAFGGQVGQSELIGRFLTTPGSIRRIGMELGVSAQALREALDLGKAADNPATQLGMAVVTKEMSAVIRFVEGGSSRAVEIILQGSRTEYETALEWGVKIFSTR